MRLETIQVLAGFRISRTENNGCRPSWSASRLLGLERQRQDMPHDVDDGVRRFGAAAGLECQTDHRALSGRSV